MHSERFISTLVEDIKNGADISSVVLHRMKSKGDTLYEVIVRRRDTRQLQTIAAWLGQSAVDDHKTYDEIVDVMLACTGRILEEEMRLFEE
jgi:hypothetical protein